VVIERWIEYPPPDYLGFFQVWIHLRNIPVNHYSQATIATIASRVGKVLEFPFEADQARSRDFVRVQVSLDVSKPLRNFKEVQTPNGSLVKIGIDYERIRKRCFHCQRLTHDISRCPSHLLLEDSALPAKPSVSPLDLAKGKETETIQQRFIPLPPSSPKLMADAIKAPSAKASFPTQENLFSDVMLGTSSAVIPFVFSSGCCDASSSGLNSVNITSSQKPRSWVRKP